MLSSEDIALLQHLQATPLKSYYALGEDLGLAAQTIKKRYHDLEDQFPGSLAVIGDINYRKIHLHLTDVYIALKSIAYAPLVEAALQGYEYIKFIARCIGFGNNASIYAQFTLPPDSISFLKQYLDIFIKKKYITHYEIREQTSHRFMKLPELNAWNAEQHRWDLTKAQILEKFASLSDYNPHLENINIEPISLTELNKTKLIILEELSINARRSDRQIYKERTSMKNPTLSHRSKLKLDVSFSTFSRAMKKIDPFRSKKKGYENLRKKQPLKAYNLIDGYRLHYSAEIFSIFDTCIFKGKTKDPTKLHQLYNLIKQDHPFKFRMNIMLYENQEFGWYLPLPSQFLNAFTEGLAKYVTPDFQLIWINYGSTLNYVFWPENFDLKTHQWKSGKQWLIDKPLDHLEQIEQKFNFSE